MWKTQNAQSQADTPEKKHAAFGRPVPRSVGKDSIRGFGRVLPILTMAVAAGCASYQQNADPHHVSIEPAPDGHTQQFDAPHHHTHNSAFRESPRIMTTLTPEHHTEELKTPHRYYMTNGDSIKEHISNALKETGIASSEYNEMFVREFSGFLEERIRDESIVAAKYDIKDEMESHVGFDSMCVVVDAANHFNAHDVNTIFGLDDLRMRKPPENAATQEFLYHHEKSHCKTYENIPTWANESISDIYASAKHIQKYNTADYPEYWADMRNIGSIKGKDLDHFTTPALNATLPKIKELNQNGELAHMQDDEIEAFAKNAVLDESVNPETGETFFTPKRELYEAVSERHIAVSQIYGKINFTRDGTPVDTSPDDGLSDADKQMIASFNASVSAVYHTEDKNLPIEQRQTLMADYYHDLMDDYIKSQDTPHQADKALKYKIWEAKKEGREAPLKNHEHAILSPETRLEILETHREKLLKEHIPAPTSEPEPDREEHEHDHEPKRGLS